jgi:hypothetical protein
LYREEAPVFDHELRIEIARDRAARLSHDMEVASLRPRRGRRAVGELMIRVGNSLARERRPACREATFRA